MPPSPSISAHSTSRQTNPSRWQGAGWREFVSSLQDVEVIEDAPMRGTFPTDAGGTAYGMPHGVVIARSAAQISALLKAAQDYRVPVTVRGGGLTTKGESAAFG